MRRFLATLATTEIRWLVVLDDVTEPEVLDDLWPPECERGWTIVTTRCRGAALDGHGRRLVDVGEFTPQESAAFLDERLIGVADRPGARTRLAQELGHLPRALAEAVIFIRDEGSDCSDYYSRLTGRHRLGAQAKPPEFQRHFDGVAATWAHSISRADERPPVGLASPLLQLISVLDPSGVPEAVLRTPAVIAWLTTARLMGANRDSKVGKVYSLVRVLHAAKDESSTTTDPGPAMRGILHLLKRWIDDSCVVGCDDVHAVMRRLHLNSLISHRPGDSRCSLRVNVLLQRAIRESMTSDRLAAVVRVAADALVDAWPEIEKDRRFSRILQANVRALRRCYPDALWSDWGPHVILLRLGRSYGETGQVFKAAKYLRRVCAEADRRLGVNHPQTLTCREALANWTGQAGDPARAAAQFEKLLADWTRLIGADHHRVVCVRHSWTYWLGLVRPLQQGIEAHERLLAQEERILGPLHPYTLATRTNIGSLRGRLGDHAGAIRELEAVLGHQIRVLGRNHPVTLLTRSNLAHWRGKSGDAVGAHLEFTRLDEDFVRVLGADNIHTLINRDNRARSRGEAGDPGGAVVEYKRLLSDRRRVLGLEHPDAIRNVTSIATWRQSVDQRAG